MSEEPPVVDRPTTSQRDPETLRVQLEQWLAQHMANPSVSGVEIPASNGMSSETVLFQARAEREERSEAESRSAGAHVPAEREERSKAESRSAGAHLICQDLVARIAPDLTALPVFPVYDMDKQVRTMRAVRANSNVPVPVVLWSESDEEALGAPFFIMERVTGEVPPDVMPYNFGSWITEASSADRKRLQDSSIRILADLHAMPVEPFAFLGGGNLRAHVSAQWDFYQWVGGGSPLIEQCFAWLEEHWPADESPSVFSWGDARIGNMMYQDFEPVAVFDWEMADVAPPEVDLGWFIFLHRFFEDIAATFSLPALPDFLRRQDVCLTYEQMSGHTPRDMDFYTLYAALRHAIIMYRIQQRAIHFGEAEPTPDPDDMIMHHATLKAMLAGTYWEGVS